MVCIYCSNITRVTNSRLQKRSNSVWRRRQCIQCGATVTTSERVALESAVLVLSESHSEPFSRDKLLISIFESCKHRNDAISAAPELTDTVITALYPFISEGSVDKTQLLHTSTAVLERFDNAAAVHYKAYHRDTDR